MRRFLLTFLLLVTACGEQPETAPPADAISWMVEHADAYLHDTSFRRAEAEASLWQPELPYARKRLTAYAFEDRGWDLLPLIDARFEPVNPDSAGSEFVGRNLVPQAAPETREDWLKLGKDVFFHMPMRRDAYLEWVVANPSLWNEIGLQTDDEGSIRGVVRFRDSRGDTRVGATCAMCHAAGGIVGQASRTLDLGKGRALFAEAHGSPAGDYAAWGPGRVDVTDDASTDALAIPDLWGAPHQSYLNASGAVRVATPASFAVRFETQYIVGHSMEARPDRMLTWALAMYVHSLQPPERTPATQDTTEGEALFATHCASCHQPERGFSGDLVGAELLPGDAKAAFSPLRGTGFYKVPSLVSISTGAPYLHDASAPDLRTILDGHRSASALSASDKELLLAYLHTL